MVKSWAKVGFQCTGDYAKQHIVLLSLDSLLAVVQRAHAVLLSCWSGIITSTFIQPKCLCLQLRHDHPYTKRKGDRNYVNERKPDNLGH